MQGDVKILIADKDTMISRRLAEHIQGKGFECRLVSSAAEIKNTLLTWIPQIILTDLILPDASAIEVLNYVRLHPGAMAAKTRVAVVSGQSSVENVRLAMTAGACDYIVKPYKLDAIIPRLAFFIQEKRDFDEKNMSEHATGGDFYLHLADLVLREANAGRLWRETLFNLTKMLGMVFDGVRCSIIECNKDTFEGFVRVSSDDYKVEAIKIDLNKYPEVLYVMNKEQMVAIENMEHNATLAQIKKHVQTISFNALIVCPIYLHGDFYGVISVRMGERSKPYADRELRFAQLTSMVASLVLTAGTPQSKRRVA